MAEEEQDNASMSEGDEEAEETTSQEGPETGRKKTTAASKKSPCLICRKACTKAQYSVKCTLCENWCHKSCSGLSDEAFKSLNIQQKETGIAFWACKSCLSYAAKVNHQFRKTERIDQVEKKTDENTKAIEETLKIATGTADKVKALEEKIDTMTERMEEMLDTELRERETRKLNVILHGLPEVPATVFGNRERMERDKKCCEAVFNAIGSRTKMENMRFCRRVGERGEQPRPVVVGLTSEGDKNYILGRARDLSHTNFKDITIVPDLTKRQRAGETKLREEATRRNQQLTQEDPERNLKWLVIGRKGERRLIKGNEREPGYQYQRNQNQQIPPPIRARAATQTERRLAALEQPGQGGFRPAAVPPPACSQPNSRQSQLMDRGQEEFPPLQQSTSQGYRRQETRRDQYQENWNGAAQAQQLTQQATQNGVSGSGWEGPGQRGREGEPGPGHWMPTPQVNYQGEQRSRIQSNKRQLETDEGIFDDDYMSQARRRRP